MNSFRGPVTSIFLLAKFDNPYTIEPSSSLIKTVQIVLYLSASTNAYELSTAGADVNSWDYRRKSCHRSLTISLSDQARLEVSSRLA